MKNTASRRRRQGQYTRSRDGGMCNALHRPSRLVRVSRAGIPRLASARTFDKCVGCSPALMANSPWLRPRRRRRWSILSECNLIIITGIY